MTLSAHSVQRHLCSQATTSARGLCSKLFPLLQSPDEKALLHTSIEAMRLPLDCSGLAGAGMDRVELISTPEWRELTPEAAVSDLELTDEEDAADVSDIEEMHPHDDDENLFDIPDEFKLDDKHLAILRDVCGVAWHQKHEAAPATPSTPPEFALPIVPTIADCLMMDVLLCHDDELEGRRIAFILYLTHGWMLEDGGTLDLFDVDSNGQPRDIIHSLVPRCNGFAFFEVSPVSFHQVAEVLSEDKVRLSVGGWFHGPPIKRPEPYIEPLPERLPCCSVEASANHELFLPSVLLS
ncbi:hypothetical protein HPB48_023766 [Haemaphysalis longicornis]|uniref:Prolyl 4-hydroxylase alpha subunit domain-containing protein n=1 Tax=Haemaphysalis longicornis TaxID=44386 RepID=A0A9J6H6P7_HAELO|nr:hypothetical protein HPB48_023766 [Haemaphysalis longicornis]